MSNFQFDRAAREAANNLQMKYRCATHGERPKYVLKKTIQGVSIEWTFCCEELGRKVKAGMNTAMTQSVGKAVEKELEREFDSIFKKFRR